jgi:hypothetical protein
MAEEPEEMMSNASLDGQNSERVKRSGYVGNRDYRGTRTSFF